MKVKRKRLKITAKRTAWLLSGTQSAGFLAIVCCLCRL